MKNLLGRALLVGTCLHWPVLQAAAAEELVVSATRVPLEAARLAAAVTVLNREDIEALHVKSLPEVLRGVAGIDVTVSGGYGKVTGVRLRGAESQHLLVLVDGVRIGSVTAGIAAFRHLQPALVERIEIVRGPRSGAWGSDALGGVIHILTRRGIGEQPRFTLDASAGSYGTFEVSGGVSGEYRDFDYSAAASWLDTDGIDARSPVPGPFGVDQPDRDGYDNVSARFLGGYEFGAGGRVEAFIRRAEGTTWYDGNFQDKSDFLQQVVGGSLSFDPVPDWNTSLRLSESRDEADNFAPSGDFSSRFNTRRRQLSWQNQLSLAPPDLLVFGLDYRADKVDSSAAYTLDSRDNIGIFGQYGLDLRGHQLLAALRWDDDEVSGAETTGGIGWNYAVNAALRLYASYGSAYRTPTFDELFFPSFGNPALRPETGTSWEVGLAGRYGYGEWSVRAYRTDVRDLIATVCDASFNCAPENVNEAQVSGIEAEWLAQWHGWDAALAVEYLDPENQTTGKRLPRRSRQRLSLDLGRSFNRLSLGARLFAEGARYDNVANTIRVGGFATVDLSAAYRLNPRVTLRARLANLFDKEYQTIDTYHSFDRNFLLSFQYRSR